MASDEIVNRALVPDNACFGCGLANPDGLHVELRRDGTRRHRLVGTLTPGERHGAYPGITHGGVVLTALGCLAGWLPAALRPEDRRVWLLRSATNVTFHRPARTGQTLTLTGSIIAEGSADEPMTVRTEAEAADGQLVTEAQFTLIPVRPERFERMAGAAGLTPGWRELLGMDAPAAG